MDSFGIKDSLSASFGRAEAFEAVRSLDLLCLGYFVSNQSDSKTGF